ncbi:MAG: hypothetical protein QOJ93_383 [Actinomycetota bacterium]|nr:hypothetical protein [Actinomycetota bacterium]
MSAGDEAVPRNRISVGLSRRNDAAGVSAGASEAPFAQVPGILGLPATILQTDAAGQDNTDATGLTTLVRREPSVSDEQVQRRRRTGGEDLIGLLLTSEVEGRRLAPSEVVKNAFNVLLGGNVTVANVVTALLSHPEAPSRYGQWAELPVAGLVEEAMRLSSPPNHFLRYACHDAQVGAAHIQAGQAVAVWFVSANRDEAVFDQPDTFRPGRSPNRHIALGAGPHYCLAHRPAEPPYVCGSKSCSQRFGRSSLPAQSHICTPTWWRESPSCPCGSGGAESHTARGARRRGADGGRAHTPSDGARRQAPGRLELR